MQTERTPILRALHYLFTQSGERIVAHCLDLDLATSAGSLDEAERKLNGLVQFQVSTCSETRTNQLSFAAPQEDWNALAEANQLKPSKLEIEVPPHVLPVTRKEMITVLRSQVQPAAA